MRLSGRFQRLLVGVLLFAAAIVAVPFAGTSAASHPLELFVSQQTGYFFFWDPAEWTLADQSSEPGVDSLSLRDGDVQYDLLVFAADGLTPIDCIRDAFDTLAAATSTVALEALTAEGGPPIV